MERIIEFGLLLVIIGGVWYEFGGKIRQFGNPKYFMGPASIVEFTKLPIDYVGR